MDGDVANRCHRQVYLERHPVIAIIDDAYTPNSVPANSKPFVLWVFTDAVQERRFGDSIGDDSPGFAEVDGPEQVWFSVVQAVPVDGHVSFSGGEMRGFDVRDLAEGTQARRRHIEPFPASVAGHVQKAGIAAGPDFLCVQRRGSRSNTLRRSRVLEPSPGLRDRRSGQRLAPVKSD